MAKKCSDYCYEEEMINTCPICGGIYCHDCEAEHTIRDGNVTIHFCPICNTNIGL